MLIHTQPSAFGHNHNLRVPISLCLQRSLLRDSTSQLDSSCCGAQFLPCAGTEYPPCPLMKSLSLIPGDQEFVREKELSGRHDGHSSIPAARALWGVVLNTLHENPLGSWKNSLHKCEPLPSDFSLQGLLALKLVPTQPPAINQNYYCSVSTCLCRPSAYL